MKAAKGVKMLKLIASTISCVVRSKCRAVRTKADAVKARLMLTAFTILSRRRNFSIESMNRRCVAEDDGGSGSRALVVYEADAEVRYAAAAGDEEEEEEEEEEKYPDLTHSLFDEEEEALADLLEDTNKSVIDQVKNAKKDGENFNLEDEIDQVADLFINKFHKRICLQKLLSFKRYQQMMERSD